MTETALSLGVAALVGIASGADAAIGGMYKDSAHEGFQSTSFLRSIVIGLCAAVAIQMALHLDLPSPGAILLLFGLAYATERGLVETWKTFLRVECQSKYTIPMQFAIAGSPVESAAVRCAACAAYVAALGVAGMLIARLDIGGGTLFDAGSAGLAVGIVIAFGGAWKDAPIEGFQRLKFFRSPVLTTLFALLLFPLGHSVLLAAIAAVGYERAASENYKKFFRPADPPGKFAGKPVTHPRMLRTRRFFVPPYVAIRIALVWCISSIIVPPLL